MPYDIAIVGGGPAGLSAAVNARARNKSVLVVSNDYRESPLYRAKQVDNYLGMPGQSGAALLDAYYRHAEETGATFRGGRVLNIMALDGTCYLGIGSEMEEARAVILCTGVSQGKKFPGEAEFLGRGVSYCATCDGMLYRDRPVAVVGLAPDAPEEANFLQGLGCQVTYVSGKRPEAGDHGGGGRHRPAGQRGGHPRRLRLPPAPRGAPHRPAPRAGPGGRLCGRGPGDEDQPLRGLCRRGLHGASPPALQGGGGGSYRRPEGRGICGPTV